LSTSAVFSGIFEAYGWGEVVPNGFGVAYMTGFDGTFSLISFPLPLRFWVLIRGDYFRSSHVYHHVEEGNAE